MSNVKRIFISSALEKINDLQSSGRAEPMDIVDAIEALGVAVDQASKLANAIKERAKDQVAVEGMEFTSTRLDMLKANLDVIYIDVAVRAM